jgi:hypothetical protein
VKDEREIQELMQKGLKELQVMKVRRGEELDSKELPWVGRRTRYTVEMGWEGEGAV